jgi:uncharacterized protein YjdB
MQLIRRGAAAGFALALCTVAACDGTDPQPAGPPAALTAVSSAAATGTVGGLLADSLAVRVTDAKGKSVQGATVSWAVECLPGQACQGLVSPAQSLSNASGVSKAALTLWTAAGTRRVLAHIVTATGSADVAFSVEAKPGPATSVTVTPRTLGLVTGFATNLTGLATDAFGNRLTVTWSTSAPNVATVDANGRVTGVGVGTATITATAGGPSATATVTVYPPGTLPATIQECETNTARVCGTWTRTSANGYTAQYAQGSVGTITVTRFDAGGIVMDRVDNSGTSTGLTAHYTATPVGNSVRNAVVTWTQSGFSFSGTWDADW